MKKDSSNQKYVTRVITAESQVPAGFVRVFEVTENENDRAHLSEAQIKGIIRAVKIVRTVNDIRGATFVHEQDAKKYLENIGRRRSPKTSAAAVCDSTDFSEGHSMTVILELRRIAAAQEKMVQLLEHIEELWKR